MSEQVSDDVLLAYISSAMDGDTSTQDDDDIRAMARELIERRASDRPDNAIVPHGIEDAVIDVREDVPFANFDDDAEPITAEWWREVFGSPWYGDIHTSWWLERNDIDSSISLRCECGTKEPTLDLPHSRTRGDLRRLWRALTGSELDERKAGE